MLKVPEKKIDLLLDIERTCAFEVVQKIRDKFVADNRMPVQRDTGKENKNCSLILLK